MSACFLLLHVCEVIQFRDDHARMRIKGPLADRAEKQLRMRHWRSSWPGGWRENIDLSNTFRMKDPRVS